MRPEWLEALDVGVDPGFQSTPEVAHVDSNYKIEPELLQPTIDNLRGLVDRGILEIVPNRPLVVNPMFAVPKAVLTGQPLQARPVIDCARSLLNAAMFHQPMALPTIRDVIRSTRKGWFASKYDLKDGFFHVPVHPAWVDFFGIRLPDTGEYARYRYLLFGGKSSPPLFPRRSHGDPTYFTS
jgi:hypothetical protein